MVLGPKEWKYFRLPLNSSFHGADRLLSESLAPNYCDQRGNDGAWLTLKPSNNLVPEPTEFKAVEHPPVPPMMYANPMLRGMM